MKKVYLRLHTILHIIIFCVFLLAACSQSAQEKNRLTFNENGRFKIVQFTDLHLRHGEPAVARTLETIRLILAAEKPDFAVITGDIVWYMPNREPWIELANVFEEAKIPFTVTFGNHDGSANTKITRSEIIDLLSQSPYFAGEKGPKEIRGIGNFVLPVYGSNNKMAALLYCFDSNTYSSDPRLPGFEPVHFNQIEWYRQQSKKYTAMNGGSPLPALAFFHIPLQEYALVAERLFPNAPRRQMTVQSHNTGLFGSFLEMEDVMGVFVGHLHGNDFIGIEKYIALAYGLVTGWGAASSKERGARIIEIYENEFVFDSWLRTARGAGQYFNFPTGITSIDEDTMTYLAAKNVHPTKQGVAYKYFEGRFGSVRNIDPNKMVSEGVMKNFSITEAPAEDCFAYEFRTFIKIPERGVYNFYTISDDDSQIYINDVLVVNKPGSAIARVENKVALEAGFHEMKVLFYEDFWGQFLEVGYSSKNIRSQKIPDEAVYLN